MTKKANYEGWHLDQITKSLFFHQKLHEYKLLELSYEIEAVKGDQLDWDRNLLQITDLAWNRVIHLGIKPVRVFAHPWVLLNIQRSVGYYQKIAMVSLKSMQNVGLSISIYEAGNNKRPLPKEKALQIAKHLNNLISRLIQMDERIDIREFDLWRGMTAGSSAQGSWQNTKGDRAEEVIKNLTIKLIQDNKLIKRIINEGIVYELKDGKRIEYSSEPDIAIYDSQHRITHAVEIKGGIDPAGVLERIGAAIKSLHRAKEENPNSTTILIISKISISDQAITELDIHKNDIDHWFFLEDLFNSDKTQTIFYRKLEIL